MKRCVYVTWVYIGVIILLQPPFTYVTLKSQAFGHVAESVSPSIVLAMFVAGNLVAIRLLFLLWKSLYQEAARARSSVTKRRLTVILTSIACVLYSLIPFAGPVFFSARNVANRADERVAVRAVVRSVMAECGSMIGTAKKLPVSAREE